MEYRRLGGTGLRVSTLTLGTRPFGGHQRPEVGTISVASARRLLDIAIDAGVNMIDTADVYGFGNAERTVGEIIKGRRDKVLIASKFGTQISADPNAGGLSRKHLMLSVEHSLRRLQTDHIDLYQTQGWDDRTPVDETVAALDQLVRDGKVRYLGCSDYAGWQLTTALAAADRLGAQRFSSQRIHYSLLAREAEHELIPIALHQRVSVLVRAPLAGGLLAGRFGREEDDAAVASWAVPPIADVAHVFDILDAIRLVADGHAASMVQVSLAWTLARPGVASAILEPSDEGRLRDALRAAELQLRPDDLALLDQVSAWPVEARQPARSARVT